MPRHQATPIRQGPGCEGRVSFRDVRAGARSRSCARRWGPIPHPSPAIQFEPNPQNIKCPLLPKLLPNTAVQSGKETDGERSEREKRLTRWALVGSPRTARDQVHRIRKPLLYPAELRDRQGQFRSGARSRALRPYSTTCRPRFKPAVGLRRLQLAGGGRSTARSLMPRLGNDT